MGSVVKAITKPFQSVVKAITGTPSAPSNTTVVNEAAPAAAAQQQVQPTQTSADSESGSSNESARRKGKKSLTIRRTNVGGGSGLNV